MVTTKLRHHPFLLTSFRLAHRSRIALGVAASVFCAVAWASGESVEPGTYEIIARTAMPHLEENLRYATTRERRCLRGHELSSVFPILHHRSEEHTSELQSRLHLVCRLLLEKKKK